MTDSLNEHCLKLLAALEPWAVRAGAGSGSWRREIFEDLVVGNRLSYQASETGRRGDSSIEVVGTKFRAKAKIDRHRDDTLYVFEIHPRTDKGAADVWHLDAHWRLSCNLRGTAIPPLFGSVAEVVDRQVLAQMVRKLLSNWGPLEPVQIFASAPDDPIAQLAQLRLMFRGPWGGIINEMINDRARRLLVGHVGATDPSGEVLTLRSQLGLRLLEHVAAVRPDLLERTLRRLLAVPLPYAELGWFVEIWLDTLPPDALVAGLAEISRWGWGRDLPPSWGTLLQEARRRTEEMTADPTIVTAGEASGTPPVLPVLGLASKEQGSDGLGVPTDLFEQRAAELRGAELGPFRAALGDAHSSTRVLADQLSAVLAGRLDASDIDRCRVIGAELVEIANTLGSSIPSAEQIAKITADVVGLTARWERLPESGSTAWVDAVQSWDHLLSVVRLAEHPGLRLIPRWFFEALGGIGRDHVETMFDALANLALVSTVERALAWVDTLPDSGRTLIDVPPTSGVEPLVALQQGYALNEESNDLRRRFDAAVARLGGWGPELEATEDLSAKDIVVSLETVGVHLDELAKRAPQLAQELLPWISMASHLGDAHERLARLERSFDGLGDILSAVTTLDAVLKIAELTSGKPAVVAAPLEVAEITVAHCLSEIRANNSVVLAAKLVARPEESEEGLFLVDLPLALRTQPRRRLELSVDIEVPHLATRKASWRYLAGQRLVVVSEDDWDGDSVTIVLRDIPTVRSADPLVVVVRGKELKTGAKIREIRLEFGAPLYEMPRVSLPFGDTTSRQDMHEHPLGVQKHYQSLIATIKDGKSSFMLTAPRRFGKTTLLEAIVEELEGSDILTVGPIRVSPEEPPKRALLEACRRLAERTNAHVETRWEETQPAPEELSFDLARKQARASGKRAIYLLFDEAQAMFAGHEGRVLAEILKQRIEAAWGREHPDGSRAPIRIGLVAQPQIHRLISGQADGVFAPKAFSTQVIQADDIESFLRKTTKGVVQTSKSARALLADVSRSLLILRHFLETTLLETMQMEQRTWFLRNDVGRAFEKEIDKAASERTALATYVLDALNGGDNLASWQPVRAYPLAIAWAVVEHGQDLPTRDARIEAARKVLDDWMPAGLSGTVPASRIEDCLRELRDLNVLDAGERFASPLLKRFLHKLGTSASPLRESVERVALQALVVDKVELPDLRSPIGRGGQATVYRATVAGRDTSVRVVDLEDDNMRAAFVAACSALRAIEGTRSRSEGVMSLPVVRAAGFIDSVGSRGAILYDYIPGEDLLDRQGKMHDHTVTAIGCALASALVLLEKRRVMHRDIKPENVVLSISGDPVLVDFGLAKLEGDSSVTRLADNDFLAPEVRRRPPLWSSKADVFAVAALLQWLRVPRHAPGPLDAVLAAALREDPGSRINPSEFALQLKGLARSLDLSSARERRREQFENLCNGLEPAFRKIAVTVHDPLDIRGNRI